LFLVSFASASDSKFDNEMKDSYTRIFQKVQKLLKSKNFERLKFYEFFEKNSVLDLKHLVNRTTFDATMGVPTQTDSLMLQMVLAESAMVKLNENKKSE